MSTAPTEHEFSRLRRTLASESPRQWITTGVALATFFAFPVPNAQGFDDYLPWLVRWMGWFMVATAVGYSLLTWLAFRGLRGDELRELARTTSPKTRRDERRQRLLGTDEVTLALSSALISLIAVVWLLVLHTQQLASLASLSVLLCAVSAWVVIMLGFACRYLRSWAMHDAIHLHDEDAPIEFSDFVFLSTQMSTGYNFEHAALRSPRIRRVFTVHNVLAYVFNTVILALLVSVALPLAL